MPRVNRLARAEEHPDTTVGYIMTIQEKIKFLGRALVGCQCPEYQEQLVHLRKELSKLQETYREQRSQLRRLQHHHQESLDNYRARITSLLQANAKKLTLPRLQENTICQEIEALRISVQTLINTLKRYKHMPPYPCQVPWTLDLKSRPLTWTLNKAWTSRNPNKNPGPDPNIKSSLDESSENFV